MKEFERKSPTQTQTNCILEIPQDIKLDLTNGVLTLKAGSKLYVPNGSNEFKVVTISRDVEFHSGTIGTGTAEYMICCNATGGFGARAEPRLYISSATDPGAGYAVWYDTTNNIVKYSSNIDGVWVSGYSLPIAIYQRTSGNVTAINQVFNGFGFIGSTTFSLPGVKVLIPNGRNTDGTLNNIEFSNKTVVFHTRTDSLTGNFELFLNNTGQPHPDNNIKYDGEKNKNIKNNVHLFSSQIGSITYSSGKVTSLNLKLPFRAVDQSDFDKLDEQAVKTSGNQIIAGQKSFTDRINQESGVTDTGIVIKNTNTESGVAPSNIQIRSYRFMDKNDKILGDLRLQHLTDGRMMTQVFARQFIKSLNKEVSGTISVAVKNDGTIITSAPTPPANDNSTQMTTTEWVRNLLTGTIDATGGYIPLPNALIQFGKINTAETTNVNLPQPFANSNYIVVISGYTEGSSGSKNYASAYNLTTTSFDVVAQAIGAFAWVAIGMK